MRGQADGSSDEEVSRLVKLSKGHTPHGQKL